MNRTVTNNERHGMSGTSTHYIWRQIKDRCGNKNNKSYLRYGGRGLAVCERWKSSFLNFLSDMGEHKKGMCLDRTDNNKGYSPDNCEWVNRKANMRNRRDSRTYYINGSVFKTSSQAAKANNVSHVTVINWCKSPKKPNCYFVFKYENGRRLNGDKS